MKKILRLRGSAVSLSRGSHKARRKVDQLQRIRAIAQPVETTAPQPASRPEAALELVEAAKQAIRIAQKTGGPTWSQSLQKRLTATCMAEEVKKQQAEQATWIARQEAAISSAQSAA